MNQTYDKIFVLDTCVILNNALNLTTLSDSGKNLIIIPETVLDELDDKKSGFDEINFQARQFARFLQTATIEKNYKIDEISCTHIRVENVSVMMISKEVYRADSDNVARSIRNDRKILEVTHDIMKDDIYKDLTFISLDVMARNRAISLGMKTEAMTFGRVDADAERDFHTEIGIDLFDGNVLDIPKVDSHISSIQITNEMGKRFIYFLSRSGWKLIDDKNSSRLSTPPIGKRQKILSELILDETDVVLVSGPAGTGKTLLSLSTAMRMIDLNRAKYTKIYYIRRTVISGTKEDELGFMPGTLDEKMQGYNQPMEDSIKKIAQLKKRDASKEVIDDTILDLKEKYDIEYLYAGHLRGSTLEDGAFLICDEIQNFDITSIRTIFSRMGKNSHIIACGSNNQIDSQYLTKNTNALTFLMDKCGEENESDVIVKGIKLTNVMRSKLSEWADLELY